LIFVALFQKGPYFKNRVGFTLSQRRTAQVTAADISALLPSLQPNSWLDIYHGANRPWLLIPGPCDFLNLPLHRQAYNCTLSSSLDDLRAQYSAQKPPKYYLVYGADGSLRRGDANSIGGP